MDHHNRGLGHVESQLLYIEVFLCVVGDLVGTAPVEEVEPHVLGSGRLHEYLLQRLIHYLYGQAEAVQALVVPGGIE